MTVWMAVLMLMLELLACYFPAVAGARGRGSRKLWIGLIFGGLFVGAASMRLGHHLLGTFDPILFPGFKADSFARQMTVSLLALIARVSISFCLGSLLAALLYRKRQIDSSSLLGLGSESNKPKM
jgi:heme/copper-type cytochrome/quinol oxidase subunit 1